MELIDDLNTEKWRSGDPNETTGFQNYRVMKCEKQQTPGSFLYAVFDDQGFLKKVFLDGGAGCRDPLSGISLVQLKLSPDEKSIHGIIVEDDCVTVKPEELEVIVSNGDDVTGEVGEDGANGKTDEEGMKEDDDNTEVVESEAGPVENANAESVGCDLSGKENAKDESNEKVTEESAETAVDTGTETNTTATEESRTESKADETTEGATSNDDVIGNTENVEEPST